MEGRTVTVQLHEEAGLQLDDWELDVTIIESGPEADRLIRMTDDNCTATCQSACAGSCFHLAREHQRL
jgi:FxLD family lantipeptide